MKKFNRLLILYSIVVLVLSCSQSENQVSNTPKLSPNPPKLFGIEGENIPLRVGPGENFDKLINEKATKILKETQYLQVDYTVKVKIEETKNDWSKIRVVEPEHLSNTHIGWIPSKYVLNKNSNENQYLGKFDENSFEIIKTEHNSSVQNFYILIKFKEFDRESIFEFTKKFRSKYCEMDCNINIYDSKSIIPLLDKYPLEKKEYIKVADHFITMSTFDASNVKSWYPYQDFQYKNYGGKNWKKEPIK